MPGLSEDTGLMGEWVGWEDSVAGQVILICPVQAGDRSNRPDTVVGGDHVTSAAGAGSGIPSGGVRAVWLKSEAREARFGENSLEVKGPRGYGVSALGRLSLLLGRNEFVLGVVEEANRVLSQVLRLKM